MLLAGDILKSGEPEKDKQTDSVAATFTNEMVLQAYEHYLNIKEMFAAINHLAKNLITSQRDSPKKDNNEKDLQQIILKDQTTLIALNQELLLINSSLEKNQNIYQKAQTIKKMIQNIIDMSDIYIKRSNNMYQLINKIIEDKGASDEKSTARKILERILNFKIKLRNIESNAQTALITAQAEQLIQEAYFSPEMQSIVLSCVHRPFRVNVLTGKVQDLPTTDEIIKANSTKDIRKKINALHTVQEALELAQLTAKLDLLIQNPQLQIYNPRLNSSFMPSLDPDLQEAFTEIQNNLTKALHQVTSKRSWSDYAWDWIPTTLQDAVFAKNVQSFRSDALQSIQLNKLNYDNIYDAKNIITIPDDLLYQIIKNFDYKQRIDAQEIADLLFQQMFVAQQEVSEHSRYDKHPRIDASNYLYNHISTFDQMITKIEQSKNDTNKSLHQHLLDIRKAVQTAMYIANKNSNYYVGMIIPAQFTWLIDGALSQLMAYDNQLAELCKDREYGGLRENQSWSWTAKIIAGVAIGGAVLGTGYVINKNKEAIGSIPGAITSYFTTSTPPSNPADPKTKDPKTENSNPAVENPGNSKPLATSAKTQNDQAPTNPLNSFLSLFNPSVPASKTTSITSPEESQENDAINPNIDENEIDMSNILNSIDPQEALVATGLIGAAGTGAYKINSKIKSTQAQADAAKKESEILLQKLHKAQNALKEAKTGAYTINSKIKATQAAADAVTQESEMLLKKLDNAKNNEMLLKKLDNTQNAAQKASADTAKSPAQPSVNKGIPSQAAKSSLQKIARTGAKGAVAAGLVGAAGYYIKDNFIPEGTYSNDDQNQ
jgi:hypothetical protein